MLYAAVVIAAVRCREFFSTLEVTINRCDHLYCQFTKICYRQCGECFIIYFFLLFAFKAINGLALMCVSFLSSYTPSRSLRSDDQLVLQVPKTFPK